MAQTYDTSTIPDASDIPGKNVSRWRIADGQFKKGREVDGSLEILEPNKIAGYITAFRIYEGTSEQTGKQYAQLEVDILTNSGYEFIKVNKNMDQDIWPTQAIGLAKYLTAVEEGKIYVIQPELSKTKNTYGSNVTFVDVALYNPVAGRLEGIQTEYDQMKFAEIVDDVFEELEDHPLYKGREAPKAEEAKSEFDFFNDACQAKSFPSFTGNETAWLVVFNEWLKAEKWDAIETIDGSVDNDEFWLFFRQKLEDCKDNPIAVAAPRKGPGKKEAPADEKDPFKEE